MAGSVLTEQYVDIVTRNLRETMDALRAIQKQADATGEALKRMKGQASSGTGAAAGVVSPKASLPTGRRDMGVGQAVAGLLPGGLGGIVAAAGPIGAAAAAIGAALAVIAKGFQGTTEMERFGLAFQQIAREAASLFAPVMRLASDLMMQLASAFRATGGAGQQLLMMALGPIGIMFEVLSRSEVQTAIKALMTAFGRLSAALQPIREVLANVSNMLLDAFVIQPLLLFVDVLTTIVTLLTEVVKRGMPFLQMMAGMVGLGKLFQPSANRPRSEVSYAQTGTEDAAGTFQRIQQAILKVGGPATEDEKQTNHLAEIEKNVKEMMTKFDSAWGVVQGFITTATGAATNPTAFAQGNTAGAAVSMGVGLLNMFRP